MLSPEAGAAQGGSAIVGAHDLQRAQITWRKMRKQLIVTGLATVMLAAPVLLHPQTPSEAPFTVERIESAPVISPSGDGFASAGTFNPAAVRFKGNVVLLYRAQDKNGTSTIGYASGNDGIHFASKAQPVFVPEAEYEKDGGVEDPRVVKFGKTYYMTYTGYNKKDAQLCLATSTDLLHWQRKGVLLPAYKGNWNVGWTKSGAIVPRKIHGRYWMYFLGTTPDKTDQMGVAYSTDLVHWTEASDTPVLARRPGFFDARVVEPGPSPIVTKDGILLIYNGADDKLVYATGWALFDFENPAKVLARSAQPVFSPTEKWEKVGQVPNVVFVEGMVPDGKDWLIYYGAADTHIGVARARLRK